MKLSEQKQKMIISVRRKSVGYRRPDNRAEGFIPLTCWAGFYQETKIMIYHIFNLNSGASYCGIYSPRDRLVNNWSEVPAGKHRACLCCVRKINRLHIKSIVPLSMVPNFSGNKNIEPNAKDQTAGAVPDPPSRG